MPLGHSDMEREVDSLVVSPRGITWPLVWISTFVDFENLPTLVKPVTKPAESCHFRFSVS